MNPSENYKIVRSAIENKQSIKAMYHDKLRLLSPHTLGHTDNHEQALFYQFGGESNSRPIVPGSAHRENWRCFNLEKLTILSIINEWHTSNDHSRPQTGVKHVEFEVGY